MTPRLALVGAACLVVGMAAGGLLSRAVDRRTALAAAPGSADIGYSQDMAAHHAQAVLMASMVRGRAGGSVSALADQIEITQTAQIGVLNGLLAAWGKPFLSSLPMRWMGIPGPGDVAMPGMATSAALVSLQTARGADVDTIFLTLMLRHHQGGVTMDSAAIRQARLPVVKQLAEVDLNEEIQEIAFMRRLLHPAPASP